MKLFKQYEGINIVVYSQPVAKIKFNPALDDFDYDVDYTKSILSQLQSAEQELETRAANERQMIASGQLPREGFETIAAASERFAHYPNINGGKEKLTEPPPPTYKTTSEIHSWQDPPESSKLNGGADEKNPSSLNRGDDRIPNPSINKGDDDKVKPANVEGVNKAKGILDSDSGVEKGNPLLGGNDADNRNTSDVETVSRPVLTNTLESNKGDDARNADAAQLQKNPTKTREFIIEPNRTITTININNGLNPVLYRKVLYNWGGLYYFKNLSISISENMFELGTGEK